LSTIIPIAVIETAIVVKVKAIYNTHSVVAVQVCQRIFASNQVVLGLPIYLCLDSRIALDGLYVAEGIYLQKLSLLTSGFWYQLWWITSLVRSWAIEFINDNATITLDRFSSFILILGRDYRDKLRAEASRAALPLHI
jgi:hypothetical protein